MLPRLSNIPAQSYTIIDGFKGINVTNTYESGELCSCADIDSACYPALGSRKKRTLHSLCDGKINGVGSHNGYFYTFYKENPTSIYLYFGGKTYNFTSYSASADYSVKRRFAFLENAILIIPDSVIFFTDTLKFKRSQVKQTLNNSTAQSKFNKESQWSDDYSFTGSKAIGRIYSNRIASLCLNYIPGTSTQFSFYPSDFNKDFEIGDTVTIKFKAFSSSANVSTYYQDMARLEQGYTVKIKNLVKTTHRIPSSTSSITEVTEMVFEDNALSIVAPYLEVNFSEVTIEKKLPPLSFITSHNNRVWGVGANKIYASKLGDADEWNDFSTDSYGTLPSASFQASAGTDGHFTAIIPHGNYIYAFKENHIHKIYGDTPDEYTISNLEAPGCAKDDSTLCVCGIYLMYASNDGICVLRDGYPRVVSKKIGDITPICAASQGGRYYLLCRTDEGKAIYVYDLERDLWTMESCSDDVDNLCSDMSSVCFSDGGSLVYLTPENGLEYEKDVHWNFKLRFDRNRFSLNTAIRAIGRINLEKNSSFTVRVIYDDGSVSAICGFCYDETRYGSAVMRLPIKRDLGFCLEFKGVGGFTLRNIRFNYYKSSEE